MITDHFVAGGSLSKILPEYEYRESQAELARMIDRCLNRGDLGFFEAGTGTGKSLAYLIPAAAFAIRHQKPVVISTHTISLQQQLLEKDIPVVQEIFPELKAVLVKGWRNYICHLRLRTAMEASGNLLDPTWNDRLMDIYNWSKTTSDGTIADLDFEPDPLLWDDVCAESDSCLRVQCPHFSQCPLFRDRALMAKSHLLIVNHHLLFADVGIRRAAGWQTDHAVLPSYAAVVIDESHHVEDVATDHLGTAISSMGVTQLLGRIFRRRGRQSGLIPAIKKHLIESDEAVDEATEHETRTALAFADAERQLMSFFEAVTGWAAGRWEDNGPAGLGGQTSKILRVSPPEIAGWEHQIGPVIQNVQKSLDALSDCITEMGRLLTGHEEHTVALRAQADGVKRRIEGLQVALDSFSALYPAERVYWIEKYGRRENQIRLVSAPIDVGDSFVEWVKAACESLVLVSATLAVSGSFDYTKERLGVGQQREIDQRMEVHERLFASPFNYPDQVMLGVVSDLPVPTDPSYAARLPQALLRLIQASQGRALVLFTSIKLLRQVKDALEEPLKQSGIPLLAQGDAPRYRLLESFRADAHSVLLGTDSFWEGVDVPGEALSTVIVTRLPFDVPTEPVAEARAERLKSMGRSPFQHYSLPRSALKLKQGFGRLIRTESDRGAVIVCDRRVIDKSYGRVLLDALPPARPVVADTDQLAQMLTAFLR